jgi:hypothetical protein
MRGENNATRDRGGEDQPLIPIDRCEEKIIQLETEAEKANLLFPVTDARRK